MKTGIHTSLVAPVDVGDRAYTGAGSVITEDVPEGALGIARAKQKNVEGYADRVEEELAMSTLLETEAAAGAGDQHHGRLREAADGHRRPREPRARRQDRRAARRRARPTPASRRSPTARSTAATRSRSAAPTSSSSSRSAAREREGLTVNDALMELLLMVHAAKHASAHRIIAVTPWYGYSRQDKKSAPREPISARLVAECSRPRASTAWSTMDLHAGQLQGFFSKPVDHMTAMPILTQFVQDRLGDQRPRDHRPGRRPREAGRASSPRRWARPTR